MPFTTHQRTYFYPHNPQASVNSLFLIEDFPLSSYAPGIAGTVGFTGTWQGIRLSVDQNRKEGNTQEPVSEK